MSNDRRIAYFDILNVISCFGVVCLHSNGYVHSFDKDAWWWLRVLVEVLFYFAVPVFFMLSGANLMEYRKRYSTVQYARKRFLKGVLPYLLWGCIFSGISSLNSGLSDIRWIIKSFTDGSIPYTAYWFFIPLFILYVYIPFLSLMVVRLSHKQMVSLLAIMIFFQSLLPSLHFFLGLSLKFSLPLGGYFMYALLGYYISTSDIDKNDGFCYSIYALAVISLIFRYIMLYSSDARDDMLFTYFGIYAIFPAIAIFLFFKRLQISNVWLPRVFMFLAKRSYGVYLIHVFLIFLLSKVINSQNPLFIPICAILVYSVSVIVVSLLQKIKLTRYLVP